MYKHAMWLLNIHYTVEVWKRMYGHYTSNKWRLLHNRCRSQTSDCAAAFRAVVKECVHPLKGADVEASK